LCLENKDYCDPVSRTRGKISRPPQFVSNGSSRVLESLREAAFSSKRARLFFGITGGTISVAESPHQSRDSESVACREGENRCDKCLRSDLSRNWSYFEKAF